MDNATGGIGDVLTPVAEVSASLIMRNALADMLSAKGRFEAVCYDADGNEKWRDQIINLVTTAGKNDLLDKYLAGSSYTQTVVMGLKGAGAAVVGDTQSSHASWSEVGTANAPAYSGTRKTPAFAAASAGSKATSAGVSFTFTSGGTVAGAFINNGGSSTIDNTTGTLFSAGDFTGGNRTVANGDSLSVTYTLSV